MYRSVLPMTGGATVSVLGVTMNSSNMIATGIVIFVSGLILAKLIRYKIKDNN